MNDPIVPDCSHLDYLLDGIQNGRKFREELSQAVQQADGELISLVFGWRPVYEWSANHGRNYRVNDRGTLDIAFDVELFEQDTQRSTRAKIVETLRRIADGIAALDAPRGIVGGTIAPLACEDAIALAIGEQTPSGRG